MKVGLANRGRAGIKFSSVAPALATSTPTTRKRTRHSRSNRRWPAGRFSSSTNMESPERLVLHDQISDRNSLGDGLLRNPAAPLAFDLNPRQTIFELFEDDPYHDAGALKGRLTTADF